MQRPTWNPGLGITCIQAKLARCNNTVVTPCEKIIASFLGGQGCHSIGRKPYRFHACFCASRILTGPDSFTGKLGKREIQKHQGLCSMTKQLSLMS